MNPLRLAIVPLFLVAGACNCGGTPAGAGPDGGPDAGACLPAFTSLDWIGPSARGRRIAVAPDQIFVSEEGLPFSNNGDVATLALDAGVDSGVVFAPIDTADAIALAGNTLLVVDRAGLTRIVRTNLTASHRGGVTAAAFGLTEVAAINAAPDAVVSTGLRWLTRFNADGGIQYLYAGDAGAIVTGLAIENSNAFFLVSATGESGLYRVPLDGSSRAQRLIAQPLAGSGLVLTPTDYWFADGVGPDAGLWRVPRDGGVPVQLDSTLCGPLRLAIASDTLIVKQSTACGASLTHPAFLEQLPLCGTQLSPLGPAGEGPGDVVVSGGSVYVTSDGTGDAGYVARLR